eukprot:10861344-Karenia_brevis.AAC.1
MPARTSCARHAQRGLCQRVAVSFANGDARKANEANAFRHQRRTLRKENPCHPAPVPLANGY